MGESIHRGGEDAGRDEAVGLVAAGGKEAVAGWVEGWEEAEREAGEA